ncbi:MAG TPA: GWxTD domain-containing protein, partial [Thermoanaerobaculia bacterium]|nr:GWxTD domain-containing protein [Thermoanaerobaculia bacterium]
MLPTRSLTLLLAVAAAAVATGCAGPARGRPDRLPEAAAWAAGPVRWLLLPQEARELASVRHATAAAAFRELFWERRDPEPDEPGNPALDRFLERVAIADRLDGSAEVDGSLGPRGR